VRGIWEEIAAASEVCVPEPVGAEDPAVLIYTSGTTGSPKGALHAHRFLIGHLPSVELQHEFFPQPGDVGWTPADWAWIGGLMDLAMPCLYHGVPLVSHRMRKFDPEAAFRLIGAHRVRTLFLPPTALKLMRQAGAGDVSTSGRWGRGARASARTCTTGRGRRSGRRSTRSTGRRSATSCLDLPRGDGAEAREHGARRAGARGGGAGRRGAEVAPGVTGEICVKAPDPVMFLGYWNQPDKTAEKLRDGWLRTGDLGTRDADGYFTYVSRDDDIITSAGYRIGPTEIENCLTGHPDVVMAAAVGVPDPVRTEVVKAFVVLREGAVREGLAEALIARVKARVSPHVAPREVAFVDSLPMTATGKIMRRELRGR
jgi:acetyl-CoA synthetase